MNESFSRVAGLFTKDKGRLLLEGQWGLERESQRVTPAGDLALTPHPSAFGSKLENTAVTTDFSESQIELVTPPFDTVEEAFEFLNKLQVYVESQLDDEMLWPLSMPPKLPEEKDIPIARFDGTREGREKEAYRNGLAHRYGKKMQMMSGIHYNFSFSKALIDYLYEQLGGQVEKRSFTDELYFSLARNFLRYRWLFIYLFGASPNIDPTYYSVLEGELKIVSRCCPECCNAACSIEQNAISLRVSRFGYSDSVRGKNSVSYNSLNDYTSGIRRLLSKKSRRFARMGLFKDGRQIQLNSNILQKESEFYSSIRLKRRTDKGETQLEALERRGVQYAEIRIIDLDPFQKEGISLQQLHFLQIFMLFCLFEKSEPIDEAELNRINQNHHLVAIAGRRQNLKLYHSRKGPVLLKVWSSEILMKLGLIASLMDHTDGSGKYRNCVEMEYKKVSDSSLLPSALILKEMEEKKEDFLEFGIRKAVEHRNAAELVQNNGIRAYSRC